MTPNAELDDAAETGLAETEPSRPSAAEAEAIRPEAAAPSRDVPQAAPDGTTNISCSRGLTDWLAMQRVSIALSTYQTGQLFLIGLLPNQGSRCEILCIERC